MCAKGKESKGMMASGMFQSPWFFICACAKHEAVVFALLFGNFMYCFVLLHRNDDEERDKVTEIEKLMGSEHEGSGGYGWWQELVAIWERRNLCTAPVDNLHIAHLTRITGT